MSYLSRSAWFLIYLITALIITGGTKFHAHQITFEVSQLNTWMWLLGGITFLQWKWVHTPWQSLPLIEGLSNCLNYSRRILHPQRFLLLCLLGAMIIGAGIHTFRLCQMLTPYEDHGIIQHVLVSSWVRSPFQCTTCTQHTYLAEHLAFSLALVAPLLGIIQRPEVLFIIQGLILALGTGVLIQKGPLRGRKDLWGFALLLILCNSHFRHTWYAIDFREDHLAFLFLSLLAVGTLVHNWTLTFMGMALSLLSKENIGFIIPAVGLLGMIENWTPSKSKSHSHQNDRRLFIFALIIALSITWVIFSFKGLMPYFRGDSHSSHEIQTRLPGLGSTPAQIVENLLSHPLMALQLILTHALGHSGLHYLTLLFLPWAFFILKGGRWSLAALPGIMMNLISNKPEQISLQWHYELVIYPFLMMAVLEGIRKCKKNELLIGLFLALAFSERWPALELREQWPSSEQWQTLQWFYHIPKEGLLASTPDLFGPAATRAELIPIDLTQKQTSFEWVHQAQWVLLNQENPSHKTLIESLRSDWVVRSQSPFNQYILLERRHH